MASSGERGIATKVSFAVSLLSGGVAGTTVDVALYPLDTIKTRLQSPQGFLKAGGFKGVYKGLGAAALGSAPGASLFFATYEGLKNMLREFKVENTSCTQLTSCSCSSFSPRRVFQQPACT